MHSHETDTIFIESTGRLKQKNKQHPGKKPFEIIPILSYATGDEVDSDSDEEVEDERSGTVSPSQNKAKDPSRRQAGQIYLEVGRQKWSNPLDSLFSLIGFAVALSNFDRFPYLLYTYGGIVFLIPYLFFTFFIAFPLMYLELILGQFVQQGSIGVWKIVPLFKGIGYCMQTIQLFLTTFITISQVWSLIFIFDCIGNSEKLPWTTCDNAWNTPNCTLTTDNANSNNNGNLSAGSEYFRGRVLRVWQSVYADNFKTPNRSLNGAVQYGFNSDKGLGSPNVDLSIYSCIIFLLLFVLLITKAKVSGRVILFFILIPFVILVVIFFRGLTLPGAFAGIFALLKPDFQQLGNPQIWEVAAIQVFYSSGAGFGAHMAFASHNNFNADIYRDALITVAVDTFTSLFAGLVVFSYLGNVASLQRKEVAEVVTSGTTLIFETFPNSIGSLPGSRFFTIIFFLFVLFIGLSTSLGVCQGISIGVTEELQKWNGNKSSDKLFIFAYIALTYVVNQLCLTRGGIWFYLLMDGYSAGFSIIFTVLFQTIVISWVWGMQDLCNAAEAMTGRKPSLYLRLCWKYIAPASLITVLIIWVRSTTVVEFNGEYIPEAARTFGIVLTYLPSFCIILYAVYQLIYYPVGRGFRERFRLLLCPENEHAQILATGSAGDRLTLEHFLYFGGWTSQGVQVRPVTNPSVVVSSITVGGSNGRKSQKSVRSSRNTESRTDRNNVQGESSLLEIPQSNPSTRQSSQGQVKKIPT